MPVSSTTNGVRLLIIAAPFRPFFGGDLFDLGFFFDGVDRHIFKDRLLKGLEALGLLLEEAPDHLVGASVGLGDLPYANLDILFSDLELFLLGDGVTYPRRPRRSWKSTP